MGFDWNNVPGYRDAALRDAIEREQAFLALNEAVCGVEVKPFALRHIQILRAIKSPFFDGGIPTHVDCARFLWIVSTKFCEADGFWSRVKRWMFYRRLGMCKINYGECLKAIHEYIADAFRESPGSSDKSSGQESYWSFSASIIDAMGCAYGWTPELSSVMPLKHIFQLLKVVRKRNNPDAPMFSYHAGQVKNEYRRKRNERAKSACK
jgi:hypothetical protein